MTSFNNNKFNLVKFVEIFLSNSTIISYGFITAIDYDNVVVTPAVTDKVSVEKIRCTFMNLGDEIFAVNRNPVLGMRVLVLSPNKAAEGMFESYNQLKAEQGQAYIATGSPAVYSSQFAFCIPIMKSTSRSLNSLVIDSNLLSLELKTEIMALLENDIEIDLKGNSSIELHEDTEHFRGCYGNMEETFGMVEGTNGTEKPGTYVYKEIYGKFSSVEKNYESGLKVTVGKAYEKPFLENKGNLVDASAPVTLVFGAQSPINLNAGAPLTLTFGESVVTITADSENGLDISLTGATKATISAETGKLSFSNSTGSLKDILDKIADLFTNMTTIGPNVVPGTPYTAAATPATAALAAELKTLVAGIFE